MKKLATRATGLLAGLSLFAQRAFALQDPYSNSITGLSNQTDIGTAIVNVITKILDFVILAAVVFVIVAGIRLVVSGGDEGQKDTAKKTIIYVIIGIIVVLFARVIVTFVANLF
jgi:succinate dehydrogenase/fumarate reductase cytochrome b subunit